MEQKNFITDAYKHEIELVDQTIKEVQKLKDELKMCRPNKSNACRMALQLMDADYSYQQAVKKALRKYHRVRIKQLESELNIYI